jgi:hypothetical protein
MIWDVIAKVKICRGALNTTPAAYWRLDGSLLFSFQV